MRQRLALLCSSSFLLGGLVVLACGMAPPADGDGPAAPDAAALPDAVATPEAAPRDASSDDASADVAKRPTTSWFPGNYVLLSGRDDDTADRDAMLANPDMAQFVGLQKRYGWAACEKTQGDYSDCVSAIRSDLAAVDAVGKKLILFLTYKSFSAGDQVVPGYMLGPGPWCDGALCGQASMGNGETAMVWQAGVAARMNAWIAGIGAGIAADPHASALAGIVFPESACGQCDKITNYAPTAYEKGIESNLLAATSAFPGVVAIQYVNFLPPKATESAMLETLADFALATPRVGLGCPDLAPLFDPPPPAYVLLRSAKYQGRIAIAPAVESPDFRSDRTSSVAATFALGVEPAPTGMGAGMISWANVKAGGDAGKVFSLHDVAEFLVTHKNPNTAVPTW